MKSHFGNKISIIIIDNMCKIRTLTECHITNFSKSICNQLLLNSL